MEGVIVNYRRGRRTEYTNQYILKIDGITNRDTAHSLLGKKVLWKTPSGKEILGKISKAHGNKGSVIARFKRGLPGQAIGTKLKIIT
ncbi:MAG: 50S ribosomal protein L35ae [Candidatus Anstonellales archaeon]